MKDGNRQKESARESDVKKGHESERVSSVEKGHESERVSSVEKVGGPTGVRFGVHNHPDKSVVTKGKLSQ